MEREIYSASEVLLLEEFFAADNNLYLDILNDMRIVILLLLKEKESVIIRDLLLVIEAFISYRTNSDYKEAYQICSPVFMRLSDLDILDFYELRLLNVIINYTESFEEAHLLVEKILKSLEQYTKSERYPQIRSSCYINFTGRLLEARYFDAHYINQKELIDDLFEEYINKSIVYCAEHDLELVLDVSLLRKGIYYKNKDLINKASEKLKCNDDDNIDEVLKAVVKKYSIGGM